jgi:glycosyltransferase involved in cell wall biosynthesis
VKVLIAIHGYPPTYYAGSERAAERIAQWLIAHGHHVEIFTCERLDNPDTQVETSTENGVVIHRLNYDLKTGDYFQNLYDDPRVGTAFRQVLEQNTFDVVHVVSGYLLGGQVIHAAKEAGIPVVLTLTEFWFMCFRLNLLTANNEMCIGPETDEKCMRCVLEDQRRFRLPAEKAPALMDAFWSVAKHAPFAREQTATLARRRETLMTALNAVDLVICPSQFIMRKFGEYDFDTSRFVHLRHGLKQPPQKFKLTDNKGVLRLGFLGQIKAHKGVDLIIDAVLPLIDQGAPISLEIWGSKAGNPSYGEGLEYQTKNYPTIRWAGSYNSDQLWNILSTMDILIIPSRWYENSPTVILEAQTFGLPVITTRLGGMQELIQHEKNGLLFELNNVKDLRVQIQRLLNEPNLLAQLRAGIPSIPTIDDEVGAIYAHYQKLTSKA